MTSLSKAIQARIEAFAQELNELMKQAALESVQEALGGGAPSRRPGRPKKKATRKKAGRKKTPAKRVRRSAEDLEATGAKILKYVRANPGQGVEGIAKALRTDSKELKRPISLLLDAKKLRTEGQKRGTKYFVGGRKKKAGKKAARKVGKKAGRKKAGRKTARKKTKRS